MFDRVPKLKRWILFRGIAYTPWYVTFIYVPLFVKEVKNASPTTVGYMFMAFWLCTLLFALPIGTVADRFGRKKITSLLIFTYIFSILLLVSFSNKFILILSGFLQGTFMLSLITQGAMGIELISISFVGEYLGLFGGVMGVFGAVIPIIVGTIWEIFSPYFSLYFAAASSLLILPILWSMPETLDLEERIS